MSIFFQILLLNILYRYNPYLVQNINIRTIVSAFSYYILPFPIFVYLMRKIKEEKIEKESLTVKKFLLYLCITITLMWFGNIIGNIITMIIGNFMTHEIVNPIKQIIQNSNPYVNLIILSIIAPIFEEIFFRKLLIDRTIKYGATLSIILSASLFGLFHGNLSQFFYAFFLGGFFAYVYTKTGKVIYPIILHSAINLIGSVVSSIFAHALKNIHAFNPVDISIVAIYAIITISALIIGLYTILSDYNIIDLNEIYLEKPVKTVVLNVGMILFILFHILLILRSLNIIKLF